MKPSLLPKFFKTPTILLFSLFTLAGVITPSLGDLTPNSKSSSNSAFAQSAQGKQALTVRSDVQEANSETGVITARGNVYIDYPARNIQATASQAQYFSNERRLVLSGDVYVLQDGNSMRAETMTYLIDEGRFIATPETQQQVESIYIVEENN